ncbi:sensor histidine kinase [Lachnospiraceae bacterium OttesenSCG-928-J05]|nr:sensor histidine kinase [Lachnospiraceae bacterium OttesenSCG-928-J05]
MKKGFLKGSISIRIFVGVFILFFFILGIFIYVTTSIYGEKLKEMEIDYHIETTNSTIEQFNVLTDVIDGYSYSLVSNEIVRRAVKDNMSESVDEIIQVDINAIASVNENINQVTILGKNGFKISTQSNPNYAFYRTFLDNYVLDDNRRATWTKFHTTQGDDYLSSTSYIRPIFNSETKEVHGIVVIDVSYESLHKLFTSSSIRLKDKAVIVNSTGDVLFQYPLQTDYKLVLETFPQVIKKKGEIEGKLFNKDVIIVSQGIDLSDWMLVRFVQRDAATESFQQMLSSIKVLLVAIVIIALLYTLWLTSIITKPIKELMKVCGQVVKGDFSAHVTFKRHDEFGRLGETFNSMISKINELFDKERSDQKRKAEMEYQILQAQINPHFLYNTLDSIKWLAVMQGTDNIAEMSTALINLLQYNLGKVEGETTLKNEIESVKNYITIQKYRYADTFEFTTMIDKEVENCKVLRFILQPLVENSIIHGFNEERGNYRIHISALILGGMLHIKVIDNGVGMDRNSTEELNQGIKKSTRFSKIGVNNIKERIQLYFGEEANLIFDSRPNLATIAEVILPIVKVS